jgi:hypothetical protein
MMGGAKSGSFDRGEEKIQWAPIQPMPQPVPTQPEFLPELK